MKNILANKIAVIATIVLVTGLTTTAVVANQPAHKTKPVAALSAKEQPTVQQDTTQPQTTAPVATTQPTETPVAPSQPVPAPQTVEDIINSAGWTGQDLTCVQTLEQLEPYYFSTTVIAQLTVNELKNYVTPCSLIAGNSTNGYTTTNLWTRSKYNIDNQLNQ